MQANRRGDLGQGVAMSIVRRRHPGAAVGMAVADRRKIQDLTPNLGGNAWGKPDKEAVPTRKR